MIVVFVLSKFRTRYTVHGSATKNATEDDVTDDVRGAYDVTDDVT